MFRAGAKRAISLHHSGRWIPPRSRAIISGWSRAHYASGSAARTSPFSGGTPRVPDPSQLRSATARSVADFTGDRARRRRQLRWDRALTWSELRRHSQGRRHGFLPGVASRSRGPLHKRASSSPMGPPHFFLYSQFVNGPSPVFTNV